ncbi:hypothetical protein TNCV_1860111 [Trichonephila clavipes]|nr:hypothetical protein TNCV_1860111 [Trichonephila clavipes]
MGTVWFRVDIVHRAGVDIEHMEVYMLRLDSSIHEITPKSPGGPPVDRDRRNAHPGLRDFRSTLVLGKVCPYLN